MYTRRSRRFFNFVYLIDYRCTLRREDLRDLRVLSTTGLRHLRETLYGVKNLRDRGKCPTPVNSGCAPLKNPSEY